MRRRRPSFEGVLTARSSAGPLVVGFFGAGVLVGLRFMTDGTGAGSM